jgi:hypothetical protein
MDRSKIKVTDRRLFTEDGELRPDYEDQEDSAEEPRPRPSPSASSPTPSRPAPSPERASAQEHPQEQHPQEHRGAPRSTTRTAEEPAGGPQFLDLVDILCQQIAIAMGDPRLGEGAPPPDLRVARVYIDLLAVLQEKTRGNLTEEEATVLEELVYRFRMLYVEKQRR